MESRFKTPPPRDNAAAVSRAEARDSHEFLQTLQAKRLEGGSTPREQEPQSELARIEQGVAGFHKLLQKGIEVTAAQPESPDEETLEEAA